MIRRTIGVGKALQALALVPAMAWASPALCQTLGQASNDGVSLWRVFGALLLCVLLAVIGALAIRYRLGTQGLGGLGGRDRRLQLLETLRIGSQVDLCIVACDGRELLIATSGPSIQLLEAIPACGRPTRSGSDPA